MNACFKRRPGLSGLLAGGLSVSLPLPLLLPPSLPLRCGGPGQVEVRAASAAATGRSARHQSRRARSLRAGAVARYEESASDGRRPVLVFSTSCSAFRDDLRELSCWCVHRAGPHQVGPNVVVVAVTGGFYCRLKMVVRLGPMVFFCGRLQLCGDNALVTYLEGLLSSMTHFREISNNIFLILVFDNVLGVQCKLLEFLENILASVILSRAHHLFRDTRLTLQS